MGLVIDDEEAEAAEKAAKEALDADAPWNEPDEDPPPPAPEGEDAEPELDADGNPVDTPAPVDYKGIAKRLAMATLPVEGEEEVDHLKLVCDACDDIRSLNIVAEDAHGETASKIVYFRVVELLFRHLRAVPAPLPPTPEPELDEEGNPVTPPAEDDKENERTLTVEEQKAADAQAEVRAKWEKVALPCARALAHLVSVPGAIRREVTDSPYFTQALFALIDPAPFTPRDALALSDVALRCMAQLARGNAAFTSAINACACGENPALAPNAGSWLTRLCAMAPPPKTEETLAEEDAQEAEEAAKKEAEGDAYVPPPPPPPHVRWRVASKAMRLATVLARSPKNRARLLRVIEPPRTPITAESLRLEREAAGNGGKGKLKIAKNEEQPADILKVAMDCAVKPATREKPGDKTTRVLALRLVRLACADASEALCRVVDRDDLDGITKLSAIVWSAETDPDVRTEAATAMLAALSKDKRAAEDFGDRNALAALTSLMPAVSDEAPELVIPPPEGGEPAAETPPEETPEETNGDGDGDGDTDDDISVTGENLLTEAFGLRPIGYITPPPKPKPFRGTQDPLPLATEPTNHPPLYQILLKLLACVITCHDETRRSITDKCAYVLTYKAKMGKPPPKPDDYDTLVRWCVTALREAVEDADPATEPQRPKTEEELAAEAEAAAAAEAEAAAAAEPEPEPEIEAEEGAGGDPAVEEVESEDEWATESVETIIPPEPDLETEEEKATRLDLEYRTWHAIHDRHIADYRWHNPDVFAAVIGVFNALSGEEAVCKSILSEEFYPGALERIIEVMPKSFATIEEGATFVTRVCEKGAYSDDTLDVEESMRRRVDLVQKLKAIAGCLAAPETARLHRGRVATLAHETALVMLPLREYLPAAGVRPVPLAEEYHTVPSVPDAPMHTWRRKMIRNVDKADVDTDAQCRVLPLHTVLPELWLDVDPKTGEPWASAGRKFARAIGSLTHPAAVQPPPEDGAEPGDLPAPSAEAFDAAVKAVSDEEATKATGPSQHDLPPKCFFSALHFITTVMGVGDAFVQPPPPEPPEEVEGKEPPPPPEPQPPLHEFHLAMWRDPESAPRRLIAAEGDESLSAKMKSWLDANLMYVDKDVMGGADPEAPEVIKQDKVLVANAKAVLAAKELALPGAYVKDAEVESEAAHLMLRWCYSVARFCELAAERRAFRIERRTDRLREKREKEKEAARLAAEAEAAAA